MPKPADIVRMIDGSNENQALTAWHKVLYAIQHIGAYESVKFDDPLIHLVINGMGGWTTLCRTNTKELHYRYAEFKERYAAYKHQKIEYYPDHLNGLLNQSTSFQSGNNQPRFISNDFLQRLPIKSLPN
jgi:hypothetical protein